MLRLDHIALGARDLARSTETLSDLLGVLPFGGGEHDLFGTHNKLWRIETAKYPIYLELLAINPEGAPKRKRWFGLEQPIEDDGIHLLGFIAATTDIAADVQSSPFDGLTPIDVARGNLRWKFGITDNGELLANGALPYLIEWQDGRHPLDGREPQNIVLEALGGNALDALKCDWPCDLYSSAAALAIRLKAANGAILEFTRP